MIDPVAHTPEIDRALRRIERADPQAKVVSHLYGQPIVQFATGNRAIIGPDGVLENQPRQPQ